MFLFMFKSIKSIRRMEPLGMYTFRTHIELSSEFISLATVWSMAHLDVCMQYMYISFLVILWGFTDASIGMTGYTFRNCT